MWLGNISNSVNASLHCIFNSCNKFYEGISAASKGTGVLYPSAAPGVGVTKPISSVPYFSRFLIIVTTLVTYWISCLTGVTCQIWIRFRWYNNYFREIEHFLKGEIDKRSFGNYHPEFSDMTTTCVWMIWCLLDIYIYCLIQIHFEWFCRLIDYDYWQIQALWVCLYLFM